MKEWIENQIADCIDQCRWHGIRTAYKSPLVAFAAAGDPLFDRLKEIIGPSHLTPRELLPGAATVISYFIPFRGRIPDGNASPGPASEDWAVAYIETNELITTINTNLLQGLEQNGYAAVVTPPTHNFDEQTLTSDWSHKHIAYIAGLGTFGLNHQLITAEGCAGRLGSLVTNALVAPTPRPAHEACLYKHNGSCTACVDQCTFGALTIDALDRFRCYDVCLDNAARFEELGVADVCGKCASGVPCSQRDPVAPVA
jgi:epoxyqueuosine reductase QueG